MLNVFFTVDVEVWCKGWHNLDEKFPAAFRQCIYGDTAKGSFGIPYHLNLLNDHGLSGIFFVEPLFSSHFGQDPLSEIVGMISQAKQEVQLHLHPEWVDEAKVPLLPGITSKRQHLMYYSEAEQTSLIHTGQDLLAAAGAKDINAFRAGSFAFNTDTLKALRANHIVFDSSYNACQFGRQSGVLPAINVVEPTQWEDVMEYPMTVFNDGTRSLRPTQVTACSFAEMEHLLWQALELGRSSFVILSHGFELINWTTNQPEPTVIKRLRQLFSFLDKNRDCFRTVGFTDHTPRTVAFQPLPLKSPAWLTLVRMAEQAITRLPSNRFNIASKGVSHGTS